MISRIKKILNNNLIFIIPWMVILLFAVIIILTTNRFQLHLYLNSFHSPFLDSMFTVLTELGNGFTLSIVFLIVLFFNIRNALFIGLSGLFSGIFTQFLKRIVFNGHMRPSVFLEEMPNLQLVEAVNLHQSFSFPSGHTTSVFALFFALSVLAKNKLLKIICFVVAVIVGFSRVYLSQHFLNDIVAGSIIGVIITFVVALIIFNKSFDKLNRPLIKKKG
jgi:membrane-associated phospholipid phosphatase